LPAAAHDPGPAGNADGGPPGALRADPFRSILLRFRLERMWRQQ
jgi:hypothetical protein